MTPPDTIEVVVDGFAEQLPAGLTLAELLERRGEPAKVVMAERNGEYVPGPRLATVVLEDGDRVELILPAFGG